MTRGEVWWAELGGKRRPVLILTRPEVIDVRALVTVAEVTTTIRGLAAEVELDHAAIGLPSPSVVNCDGLHTVAKTLLRERAGSLDGATIHRVCRALSYALGC